MKKSAVLLGIGLILGLTLTGCGEFLKSKPVPKEFSDMIGVWKNDSVTLSITAEGNVSYQKKSGNLSTSISAPIKTITKDRLEIGALFIHRVFTITLPPADLNGETFMTVDNEKLKKITGGRRDKGNQEPDQPADENPEDQPGQADKNA